MPGRTLELPRSEIDDDGRDGTFRGIWSFLLGFLRRGGYIGEGWALGASQGHHTLAGRGPTLGRAPMGCGSHLSPQGVSLPPLSFFFPAKLDQKLFSRVLAVLEHGIFDLFAQPISAAEIWLICSPVCDSSVYPSRILFG